MFLHPMRYKHHWLHRFTGDKIFTETAKIAERADRQNELTPASDKAADCHGSSASVTSLDSSRRTKPQSCRQGFARLRARRQIAIISTGMTLFQTLYMLWLCVSLSVRNKPDFCVNGWKPWAGFRHKG